MWNVTKQNNSNMKTFCWSWVLATNLFWPSGVSSFVVGSGSKQHLQQKQFYFSTTRIHQSSTKTESSSSSTSTSTDDLLNPDYEIEPLTTRIGHGFDIHRMAPIEEAGQPVVIGGVEITHKDQKVKKK